RSVHGDGRVLARRRALADRGRARLADALHADLAGLEHPPAADPGPAHAGLGRARARLRARDRRARRSAMDFTAADHRSGARSAREDARASWARCRLAAALTQPRHSAVPTMTAGAARERRYRGILREDLRVPSPSCPPHS